MNIAVTFTCKHCQTKLASVVDLRGKISDVRGLTECHTCGMLYEVTLQLFAKEKGFQRRDQSYTEHSTSE